MRLLRFMVVALLVVYACQHAHGQVQSHPGYLAHGAHPQVSPLRFLVCIREIEQTPDNLFGLSRETWMDYMHEPYLATPDLQIMCAHRHFLKLHNQLHTKFIRDGVYEMAVCWLLGFDGGSAVLLNEKIDPVAEDYGTRISNLYYDKTFHPKTIPTL